MKHMRRIKFLSLMVMIGSFCVSCASTHQVRNVETSGFLNNYSQLAEGEGDQALMVYIDPDVNFDTYDKLIIDPIRLIATEGSDLAEIDKEDSQAIADYFFAALNEQLAKNYTIVKKSGSKTLQLKVALTDMTGSKVVLDTLSSLVPVGMAINLISKVATGNNTAVGSATGEMELLDSATGKRLIAAVDGRAGTKYTGKFDKWGKWNDTKDACDHWAERITTRLDELSAAGYLLKGDEK
jgi:hypothetical protein